jgi:hypothetical protein
VTAMVGTRSVNGANGERIFVDELGDQCPEALRGHT